METKFAPPESLTDRELAEQVLTIQKESLLGQAFDAIPNIILVLNKHRQVIYANRALMRSLNLPTTNNIFGLRPGEILHCIHSSENDAGCGTTEFCRECGAANAILNSQTNGADVQECRIIQEKTLEALDFRVNTSQLAISGQNFTVFAVTDISNEKRREVLEQTFFHDVLNTANGVLGYTEMLRIVDQNDIPSVVDQLRVIYEQLVGEIKMQRLLTQAETGELTPEISPANAKEFLKTQMDLYQAHPVARNKHLVLLPVDPNLNFDTDATILRRVIGNMLKNALEAINFGETVTCSCTVENGKIQFSVHNPTFMPRPVQLQMFQRSFSTKGKGRGLGTYSMKMLSERYLSGKVSFTTDPTDGTRFFVEYPLSLQP